MSDDIDVGSAKFKVEANLGSFTTDMAMADDAVSGFADTVAEAMGPLLAMVAGFEAIKGLFVDGMSDLENYDNALETTVSNIERMGGGYVGLKEHLADYAEQQSLTTKFQKTEVLNTLNELYTRTKDLGEATYVNGLAMDLAAAKHMSLAEAGNMLARALTGDQRGVMMLGRELGISKDAGMDAADMFKILEERFGGAAKAQNDMQTESQKLDNNLSQLREDIVGFFVPAWEALKRGIDIAATAMRHFFGDTNNAQKIKDLQTEIAGADQRMMELTANSIGGNAALRESMAYQVRLIMVKKGAWEMELQQLQKIEKGEDSASEAAKRRTKGKLDAITDANNALAAQEQMTKNQAQLDEQTAQAFKRYEEDKKKELEDDKKIMEDYGKVMEKSMEEMVKAMQKGENGAKAFGQALKQAGADAVATILEMYAKQAFAQASFDLTHEDYAGALEYAAGGAILEAAAGAVKGMAGAAKGGYVVGGNPNTDTVPVMVKQNEAIVPLDDSRATNALAKAMGGASGAPGGVHMGDMHVHVYGVQRPEDFSRPGVKRSVGRQILDQTQAGFSRSGQRFANVGA